jgi:hypothetical protein
MATITEFGASPHLASPPPLRGVAWPLHSPRTKFTLWCDSTMEVFDLDSDAWELVNTAAGAGAALAARELALAVTLGQCSGSECSSPTPGTPKKRPLQCKNTTKGVEGWW